MKSLQCPTKPVADARLVGRAGVLWRCWSKLFAVGILLSLLTCTALVADAVNPNGVSCSVRLTVTSKLPFANVPTDPTIDFANLIRQADLRGVLDPNSIAVIDLATSKPVPCAVTEDFAYGDRGRVEWVIADSSHRSYEIRFNIVAERPPLRSAEYTPQIGVGDLLRYNAGVPRPIAMSYLSRLVDLTGDGKRDLVGCWNYAYRPGWPWDGVICYPRVGKTDRFEFGDLTRIRHVSAADSEDFQHFRKIYMHADFADLNRDGLIDLVYSPSGGTQLQLYLNTGRRDAGGMPVFAAHGSLSRQTTAWQPCRAVDLNADKAIDFYIGSTFLRNTNLSGWPIQLAEAVTLNLGHHPCFYDVDADGRLDAVSLVDGPAEEPRARRVAWRKNLGGETPRFGAAQLVDDIGDFWCSDVAAVSDGPHRGLLVQHDVYGAVSFYQQLANQNRKARFRRFGRAGSSSAVLSLSDQAWPCICDWDDDGDFDLLVGGGYGWPRIVINEGDNLRPAFAEVRQILSEGHPIRILRDEVLGSAHWHNMGYPYPVYADWNADGLSDLLLPNETNRIFWYRNIGTRKQPKFGPRRQLICEAYPDSAEYRQKSARLAGDRKVANHPYPYEEARPFFWRTGAAVADMNGDGLADIITHDGFTRKATLFTQYRGPSGVLRLKKDRALKLSDGRLIDDSIVGRRQHWTESFRTADWDGDGLTDIIYSCAGSSNRSSIYLLRNVGTKTEPLFDKPQTLCCFGQPIKVSNHGPHPWIADINGDGKPDILTCVEWSVYPFYSHAAVEMQQRPEYVLSTLKRR